MRKYMRKTRLHKYLDKMRMTQKMFAAEVGVEASAVSLWLSGKRLPTDGNIQIMSRILQVEPNRLKAVFLAENLLSEHGANVFVALSEEAKEIVSSGEME